MGKSCETIFDSSFKRNFPYMSISQEHIKAFFFFNTWFTDFFFKILRSEEGKK